MMGWKLDDPAAPAPRVLTDWDEASCTQLVYLYTEVARNFGGDARRFFQVTGKPRGRPADGKLSIASIDVGGGTTDLIINLRPRGAGTSVRGSRAEVPRGLQRGGRRHPAARRARPCAAAHRGGDARRRHRQPQRPDGRALGGDRGGEDVIQRNLRQQFALQVAHPIALEFMRAAETYDPTSGVVAAEPRPYDSFFPKAPSLGRSHHLRQRSRPQARRQGLRPQGDGVPRRPARPRQDGARRDGRVLAPLAEIVHAYDCDVLLLSGRPSRLPASARW